MLFIGSGKLNPAASTWAADEGARREIAAGRIVTVQKYPWRSGGNVMVVPGEDETVLRGNLVRLHEVWLNGKRCPVPVQYLTSALKRFAESLGWKVEARGSARLELTRQDGRRTTCFVHSRYDDNFSELLAAMLHHGPGPMVVYGYDGDLSGFKARLSKEGWKADGKGRWGKDGVTLDLSFAITDQSLNVFSRGMWPERK